jgi:pimeloyl-ACP methyl ester carboxylesterase
MEAIAHTLPYDLTIGAGAVPTERLGTIAVPTLSVFGSTTSDFLRGSAEAVARAIPGAESLVLEGHGHGAPPDVSAAMLLDFLLA